MGIFSSKPRFEPTAWPKVSITGKPNFVRCELGGAVRRVLLMASAVRVVAEHPVARPNRSGEPLLGPSGLTSVVETLRPMFAVENALVPWIALRGALLFLQMTFRPSDPAMAESMGIHQGDHSLLVPTDAALAGEAQSYLSLYRSLLDKLRSYDELEQMSLHAVLADPRFRGVDTEVGFQMIAWAAVAMLRTGRVDVVHNFGEPGRIDSAGWYTEPLFAKAERYHDGRDWTNRCRAIERGREMVLSTPLR